MAMLPAPYMSQSCCLAFKVLEPFELLKASHGKYKRRVATDSNKSNLNKKTLQAQFSNPTRTVPCNHHVPKALSISGVSIVETTRKHMSTYRFMTETGGQLKVLVRKKNNNKYGLRVELDFFQHCEGKGELYMVWGLFRDDSEKLMPLDFQDNKYSNTIETPFIKDSVGNLALDLELKKCLAPFYVSLLLKSQLGTTYRSHRNANFIVPVGFGSGRPFPLGISFLDDGFVNFAFFSRNVESVVLCLYTDTNMDKPSVEIDLDPYVNRSGDIWHALVDCSLPFVSYGYRCKSGDENKEHHVILDPYARIIEDFGPKKCLGKLIKEPMFDWNGDFRPNLPMENLIIYRLNVARFTEDKSSMLPGEISGTFSGISEKLDHFKSLGVNAILLEPIFPFDKEKGPYHPYHFFSPISSYGFAESMKEMVKKLHANGIEVFLEVVFTSDQLREIDDSSYYNTSRRLNCNVPIVQQMILESLQYWVVEFHIDGFCFVDAFSLTSGGHGEFLARPPLIEAIAFDPLLSSVRLIADSWSPQGTVVGTEEISFPFPHWKRWAEMNGSFCFDVRNFLRGKALISSLATRICGSGDRFLSARGPQFSFNFITRNSGFTLVDLVSFNGSELGSESESECSWNCGEEGLTDKTTVLERRLKQIRNFLFILFISLGVPVLNMGDECGQSCCGSTAYSNRSPLDWKMMKSGFGIQITQFISFLSSLRMRRGDFFQRGSFMDEANIEWHGTEGGPPDWDDEECRFLAVTLKGEWELGSDGIGGGDMFVAFNSGDCSEKVVLPEVSGGGIWVRVVDTSLGFPGFFSVGGVAIEAGLETYEMESNSCVLFEARS